MPSSYNSWHVFHYFLVAHYLKYGFSDQDAESKAELYNFWGSLGFEYEKMKQEMEQHLFASTRKEFAANLGNYVYTRKEFLDKDISIQEAINLGRNALFNQIYFHSIDLWSRTKGFS